MRDQTPQAVLNSGSLQASFNFLSLLALLAVSWTFCGEARAAKDPIHHSADKEFWRRRDNILEMYGHAEVNQPGETIQADYILLDLSERNLDAKGNVVYITSDSVIYGEEMHFSLETRTGTILGGRILNSQFTLVGERISKLSAGRFQTHWGEYTTCHDCPGAWTLAAEDVDMIFGGYAFFKNVTAKIKDTPTLWLPYLIVPIKTQRQTGFLFPKTSLGSATGLSFVLPFFWAIMPR